jgi:hypothetical protein
MLRAVRYYSAVAALCVVTYLFSYMNPINTTSTLLSYFCNLHWTYSVQASWNIVVCLLLRDLGLFHYIITSVPVIKLCQALKSDIFLCLIAFVTVAIKQKDSMGFV